MTSAGSVSIELRLERSQFDKDLALLQQEKVGALAVHVKLDVKDFERQIKGLTGFIPTVSIPVELDVNRFKEKLKNAKLNCIPVDICPNIDGLQRKLKAATKQLDCIPVDICIDEKAIASKLDRVAKTQKINLEADTGKLQRELNSGFQSKVSFFGGGGDTDKLASEIGKSFEQAVSKLKSKSLFSQVLGLVVSPLVGLASIIGPIIGGTALGIGLPLGQKIGQGLARGLEQQSSTFLGSFEFLGEKISTLGAAIGSGLAESVLGSFVSTFTDKAKSAITEILGSEDVAALAAGSRLASSKQSNKTASSAQKQLVSEVKSLDTQKIVTDVEISEVKKQQQEIERSRTQARAVLEKLTNLPVETRKNNASEIREVLKATQNDLAAADKAEIALLERRTELQAKKAKIEVEITKKVSSLVTLGNVQAVALADAEAAVSQSSSQIERLKARSRDLRGNKSDPLMQSQRQEVAEQLKQARADYRTKSEQVSARRAELLSYGKPTPSSDEQFRSIASGYVFDLRKSFVEAMKRVNKSLEATQQINIPGFDASDRVTKEIAALQSLEERNKRLRSQLKNFDVLPVSEISKIQAELETGLAEIREIFIRLDQVKKEAIAFGKAQTKPNLPPIYVKTVQKAAQLAGLESIPEAAIPKLVPDAQVPGRGEYNATENTYRIRPDLFNQINTSDIDQITDEALGNIVHEIFHAFQHGFGKAIADETGKPQVNIAHTPEELKKVADKVEASVSVQPESRQSLSRELETGANVFQMRNTPIIREQLRREKLQNLALNLGGLGGAKIAGLEINKVLSQIQEFFKEAQSLGIDASESKKRLIAELIKVQQSADKIGRSNINLDSLSTEQIESVVKEYQGLLQQLDKVSKETQKLRTELTVPVESDRNNLRDEMLIQSQLPQLKRAAKELGVKGISKKDKAGIVDAILGSGADEETIRSKLPKPRKNTSELVKEAQQILSLTTQEISQGTLEIANQFKVGIKTLKTESNSSFKKAELERILSEIDDAISVFIAAKVKSSDQEIKNILEGRIKSLQKQRAAASIEIRPLQAAELQQKAAQASQRTGRNIGQIAENEIDSLRRNLSEISRSTLPLPPPPWEMVKSLVPVSPKLPTPPPPWEMMKSLVPVGSKPTLPPLSTQTKQTAASNEYIQSRLRQIEELIDKGAIAAAKRKFDSLNQEMSFYLTQQPISGSGMSAETFRQMRAIESDIQQRSNDKVVANLDNSKLSIFNIRKRLDRFVRNQIKSQNALLANSASDAVEKLELALLAPNSNFSAEQTVAVASNIGQARNAIAQSKKIQSQASLSNKDIELLEAYNKQLQEFFEKSGQAAPNAGNLKNKIAEILGPGNQLVGVLANLVKGFIAFQAGFILQGVLSKISVDAFKAYVELDRLKTGLNFASGGSAGGARNLAFVRKQVEDLGIPLKSSTEGFVGLAGAARRTALEGQGTRDLFLGMAQASTVLSLSNEQTQRAFKALTDSLSKGKISAEEMRGQLAESGLTGAMGIAARAMGVTEEEFSRLLDTGQILSQDFLPKFAKQLQAEFGDAAKDASNNAQSAIFKLENAFLSLQQGIGEGVAPAAIAGFNTLSLILKGLASISKEIGFIFISLALTLSGTMLNALKTVVAELIATRLATGMFKGGLANLFQAVNKSPFAMWSVGIFAALEAVKLLSDAVNTDLVNSFNEAAEAAKRGAEESRKAFEKAIPEETWIDKIFGFIGLGSNKSAKEPAKTEPVASSGVGRFLDQTLVSYANFYANASTFGLIKKPFKTYGELEQQRINEGVTDITTNNNDFLGSAKLRLAQLKSRTGATGQLPAIDATLRDAEQQRQILQANIKRNFIDKGLATPAVEKSRLEALNLRIADFNNQRAEIAKPFNLDISRTDQRINEIKAQLEALKSPQAIAAAGGDEAATKLTEELKASLENLKEFKNQAETTLASLRVDPVLAFTSAIRKLNLAFAEGQEKNQQKLADRKLANAKARVAGFQSNPMAARQSALNDALAEQEAAATNVRQQQTLVKGAEVELLRPEFQPTLQKLGITSDSSVAKIQDVLNNATDEADKGILEKAKAAAEQKLKLKELQQSAVEAQDKVGQQVQDNSLYVLQQGAAKQQAALQRAEAKKLNAVKMAQQMRLISETDAAEKIARIQLGSTTQQQRNTANQLAFLRTYHQQGKIGAEQFVAKQQELTTQQTDLEKQAAEQRLAVSEAVNRRKLEQIELANKKAEAAIALSQTNATTAVKQRLLRGGMTPELQERAGIEQNAVDQEATAKRVDDIKRRIAQTKELEATKVITAKESTEKLLSLNQELAVANQQRIDQQIEREKLLQDAAVAGIERQIKLEENRFKLATSNIDQQKSALDLYNESLDRTAKLEESRYNLSKVLSDASISGLEIRKGNADRALDLSRRLKDENTAFGVRGAIASQLNSLGFGTNELQILEKRSQIEDEIAAKKLEALKLEQAYQRQSLQLDLKRQKISAQMAVFEAESAKLAAAKAKLEAESALRIAVIKKDKIGIEAAKAEIELAGRGVELADKKFTAAEDNLKIQDELARNATLAQEATQKAALNQELAADSARRQAAALERVEASASKIQKQESGDTKISSPTVNNDVPGWENPYIQKPGEGLFDYESRINWMKMTGQIVETNKRTSVIDTSGYNYDLELNKKQGNLPYWYFDPSDPRYPGSMPPIDRTADMMKAAEIKTPETSAGYNQFADALKVANQGIEQRLDTLNERIMQLANSPRSLTVQSPNAVDDAADIMSKISRQQLAKAGL